MSLHPICRVPYGQDKIFVDPWFPWIFVQVWSGQATHEVLQVAEVQDVDWVCLAHVLEALLQGGEVFLDVYLIELNPVKMFWVKTLVKIQ